VDEIHDLLPSATRLGPAMLEERFLQRFKAIKSETTTIVVEREERNRWILWPVNCATKTTSGRTPITPGRQRTRRPGPAAAFP
jgi:hypothetical protein